MPRIQVLYYKEDDGTVPVLDFLDSVSDRIRLKLIARISRLRELGFELRRPEADYLRYGIYELRTKLGHVNYRMLYFYYGRTIAVISAGFTKEGSIPPIEIERAIRRKSEFQKNPRGHTYISQE